MMSSTLQNDGVARKLAGIVMTVTFFNVIVQHFFGHMRYIRIYVYSSRSAQLPVELGANVEKT